MFSFLSVFQGEQKRKKIRIGYTSTMKRVMSSRLMTTSLSINFEFYMKMVCSQDYHSSNWSAKNSDGQDGNQLDVHSQQPHTKEANGGIDVVCYCH